MNDQSIKPYSLSQNRIVYITPDAYIDKLFYSFSAKLQSYFAANFNLSFEIKAAYLKTKNLITLQKKSNKYLYTPFMLMPTQQEAMLVLEASIANLLTQQDKALQKENIYLQPTLKYNKTTKEQIQYHITNIINQFVFSWQCFFPKTTLLQHESIESRFNLQLENSFDISKSFYHLRINFHKNNFYSFIDLYLHQQQILNLFYSKTQKILLNLYTKEQPKTYIKNQVTSILEKEITYPLEAVLEQKKLSIHDLKNLFDKQRPLLLHKRKDSIIELKLNEYTVAVGTLGQIGMTLSLELQDTYLNPKKTKPRNLPFIPLQFRSIK